MTKVNAANWIAAARQSSPQPSVPQPSMIFAIRAPAPQFNAILRVA